MITTKVSRATPAPNNAVITMSRTKPRTLEIKVQKETNPLLSNSFKDFFCKGASFDSFIPLKMIENGYKNKMCIENSYRTVLMKATNA